MLFFSPFKIPFINKFFIVFSPCQTAVQSSLSTIINSYKMQNLILSLEGQFPQIYSQSKLLNSSNCMNLTNSQNVTSSSSSSSSHSSSASSLSTAPAINSITIPTNSDEILPNKLPLKRRLSEFRFGRDGGTLTVGKKVTGTSVGKDMNN
jgi:hypothetical protein